MQPLVKQIVCQGSLEVAALNLANAVMTFSLP